MQEQIQNDRWLPFITCAVKKKGLEFCWDCRESGGCKKWRQHREFGRQHDTFKSYQTLEDDIFFAEKNGIDEFENEQKTREKLLKAMLKKFDEGRSKNYYCIAATIMETKDLIVALDEAKKQSKGLMSKEKAKVLHSILDSITRRKGYILRLRPWKN